MADRLRDRDWGELGLGPIEDWDPGLIAALNLMLDARFPMFVGWGADLCLFHNDAYETALIGKSNILGRPMQEVFPEAWPQVGPMLGQALSGQSVYMEDFSVPLLRNSQLSATWWTFSYSPVRTAVGDVGGVLGVVHETTRRFLADEALRYSEAAIRSVADKAPSLLWKCEPDGRLTWVNQRLQDYYRLGDLGDVYWDDRVHPDDVLLAQSVVEGCQRDERTFECQQRLRSWSGDYRWFMVRCERVVDGAGEVIEWCGSAIDIDDWRKAIDGLSERDEMIQDFHGADATLLWIADVATREVTPVNPQSRTAWALPIDGGISWDAWTSTVHPDDRVQFAAAFDRAAEGNAAQVKFRELTGVGPGRRFQLTAFPIGSDDGEVRRVGGMVVELGRENEPRIYLVGGEPRTHNQLAHTLTRRGFRVRSFDAFPEFEKVVGDLLPGCVILCIDQVEPALRTAAALSTAKRLPWLAVGDFTDRLHDAVRLMKLGAVDILSAPGPDEVADASQAALALARPETVRDPGGDARQKIADLTRRERQVLDGLVAGGTNKIIAQKLNLSPRTVETHRAHLMDRLGVSTLADLIRLAGEAGVRAN